MRHDDLDWRPPVVMWFKWYCVLMCCLYLAVAGFSLICLFVPAADLEMEEMEAKVLGAMLLVLGLGLFAAFALPLVLTVQPWLWVYDLVLICLGLTSACCLPISIPLLIYWLQPETKRYFGRET